MRLLLSFVVMVGCCLADETWKFDRLDQIGGHKTTVFGQPKVIDTPLGKAIQFNGVEDAIYVDVHPLAGFSTFTWELIFRADADGKPEQRIFHLQEDGSDHRLLFETRLIDGRWCLDSFASTSAGSKPLLDRAKLHSTGEWHHVAMVYDGHEFRHYVDRELQGSAVVALSAQGKGKASMGTRFNKKDYFKGAFLQARMTGRALAVSEFLPLPTGRSGSR